MVKEIMKITMSSPDITQAEIDAVMSVLHTQYLSFGPHLTAFEEGLSRYVGIKHGIAVNSGTSGLHLCMIAAGIGEGDEVITPSFSFIASANAILYERAIPVFVDIDPLTGNMDPRLVEEKITPKTKAIMPVHAFGQPVDMDPILEIARKHNLFVIEDACEAIGSQYKGRYAGTMGDAAVFAFYPNKQITTGEGGMIISNRDDWAEMYRSLRNQGRDVFNAWLNHTRLGYNYRLDEMSAALGAVQVTRLDDLLNKRAQVAQWYNERINEIPGIEKPHIMPTTTRMSWFVYVVRCGEGVSRNALMENLQKVDIPTRPYFVPIHLQPFYQERFGYEKGDFPNTEQAGETFIALPFSGVMTEDQVNYVCEHIRSCVNDSPN